MLKLVESYSSLSPQSLRVVVCPWCQPWVASLPQEGFEIHAFFIQPKLEGRRVIHSELAPQSFKGCAAIGEKVESLFVVVQ